MRKAKECGFIFSIFVKSKIMSIALTDKTIEDYWSLIRRLDNNSKKKLIIRLAESIEIKEENKFDLESLFGAWEDSRDSDEIIKEIRESRANRKNIV